jgi:hypothetical protein
LAAPLLVEIPADTFLIIGLPIKKLRRLFSPVEFVPPLPFSPALLHFRKDACSGSLIVSNFIVICHCLETIPIHFIPILRPASSLSTRGRELERGDIVDLSLQVKVGTSLPLTALSPAVYRP